MSHLTLAWAHGAQLGEKQSVISLLEGRSSAALLNRSVVASFADTFSCSSIVVHRATTVDIEENRAMIFINTCH